VVLGGAVRQPTAAARRCRPGRGPRSWPASLRRRHQQRPATALCCRPPAPSQCCRLCASPGSCRDACSRAPPRAPQGTAGMCWQSLVAHRDDEEVEEAEAHREGQAGAHRQRLGLRQGQLVKVEAAGHGAHVEALRRGRGGAAAGAEVGAGGGRRCGLLPRGRLGAAPEVARCCAGMVGAEGGGEGGGGASQGGRPGGAGARHMACAAHRSAGWAAGSWPPGSAPTRWM
jgi:hypothetical protein